MPRLVHLDPSYRKHRASGQAAVTLDGRVIYLGPYESAVIGYLEFLWNSSTSSSYTASACSPPALIAWVAQCRT